MIEIASSQYCGFQGLDWCKGKFHAQCDHWLENASNAAFMHCESSRVSRYRESGGGRPQTTRDIPKGVHSQYNETFFHINVLSSMIQCTVPRLC